ncbi:hypothetical protein BDF21DRAFT_416215 [Thamnidium elegans]|nr:hypothetical protein BDF21DRAFT_416215 [Thamnidium elegans]
MFKEAFALHTYIKKKHTFLFMSCFLLGFSLNETLYITTRFNRYRFISLPYK